MTLIETMIEELKSGKVSLTYPPEGRCTTEGEIIILLERLNRFEKIGLEPEEIQANLKLPTGSEYKFICRFADESYFDSREELEILRALWTPYSFHKNMDPDTFPYDDQIFEIWEIRKDSLQEFGYVKDFAEFDNYMARLLV